MHREKQTHYTDEDVNSWASIIAQHTYARHPPVPSFFLYGRYVLCKCFPCQVASDFCFSTWGWIDPSRLHPARSPPRNGHSDMS